MADLSRNRQTFIILVLGLAGPAGLGLMAAQALSGEPVAEQVNERPAKMSAESVAALSELTGLSPVVALRAVSQTDPDASAKLLAYFGKRGDQRLENSIRVILDQHKKRCSGIPGKPEDCMAPARGFDADLARLRDLRKAAGAGDTGAKIRLAGWVYFDEAHRTYFEPQLRKSSAGCRDLSSEPCVRPVARLKRDLSMLFPLTVSR